jgi:energy-coupling factor transporter ATP-binding protein EcfA2
MNNCYLDAKAVITFFRMTGRKHIFITGSRGSGKSHLVNNMLKHMSDSFNLLQSHRTDTPQVVIKSNLVADNKEFVIGVPRTSGINPASKGNNMTIIAPSGAVLLVQFLPLIHILIQLLKGYLLLMSLVILKALASHFRRLLKNCLIIRMF